MKEIEVERAHSNLRSRCNIIKGVKASGVHTVNTNWVVSNSKFICSGTLGHTNLQTTQIIITLTLSS